MAMKRILALIVLFFSIQNSQVSYAACTDKDLTDPEYLKATGRGALVDHFKKPRHQDSVGWCGAFATADSLSFAVGEPVSALDVSLNEYANTEDGNKNLNELYGISVVSASNVAKKNGYCPESVIPSDQTSSSNLGHYAIKNLMSSFQKIIDDFRSKGKPSNYCIDCSTAKREYENVIKPSLPNVTTQMIQQVLVKNNGNSLESMRDLMGLLCAGNRKKPNIEVNYYTSNSLFNKKNTDAINNALDSDSMPSIVMSASNFTNSTSEEHEMVVVGRRMEKGQCVYVVRNSWGRGCYSYNSKIVSCDPEKGTISFTEEQINSQVSVTVVYKNKDKLNTPPTIVKPPTTDKIPDDLKPPRLQKGGNGNNNSQGDLIPPRDIEGANRVDNSNNSRNSNNTNNSNNSINKDESNNSPNSDNANIDTQPNTEGSRFDGAIEKGKNLLEQGFEFLSNLIKGLWQALSSLFKY
jgi:hypothetical protein